MLSVSAARMHEAIIAHEIELLKTRENNRRRQETLCMPSLVRPSPQKKQRRAGVNAQQHQTRNPVTEHRHRRMPSTQSVRLDKDILHSCDTPFESSTFLHVRERECETDDSSRSNGEHHDAQCTPQAVSSMGKLPLWTPAAAPHCLSSFSAYIRRPRMI